MFEITTYLVVLVFELVQFADKALFADYFGRRMKAQAVKGSPRPGGALLGIDPLKASKLSDFKGSTEKLLNSKKQPKTKKPSFAAELPPRHKQNPSLSGKQSVIKFMAQNLHEIVHRLGESRRSPMGAQARHMKSNSGDQPEYFNGILGGMPKGKPLGK